MSKRSGIFATWSLLLAGVVAGIMLASLVVFIQYQRAGWPFAHGPGAGVAVTPAGLPGADHAGQQQAPAHARVAVSLQQAQQGVIGIRLGHVRRETLSQPLRAAAYVVPDETRVTHVHTRISGWLEELYVNSTGQAVTSGQPVAAVFSQELYASQLEYLEARKEHHAAPDSAVMAGAKKRLQLLGMSNAEIADIERKGEARRRVTLVAPHSGVVMRLGVAAGTAVDPSTEILTVADLSSVWIWAEVPETAAQQIRIGTEARLEFTTGLPPLTARVDFLYPTLTEKSRTLRVRFSVPDPQGLLRPGLFGTAHFATGTRSALLVSRDAVVDTGLGQHVFVATADDVFEPRQVVLGARTADSIEVLEGLAEGERIVASGVFLLDSESRLRASGGAGTGHAGHGGGHGSADNGAEPAADMKDSDMPPASGEAAAAGHAGHGE